MSSQTFTQDWNCKHDRHSVISFRGQAVWKFCKLLENTYLPSDSVRQLMHTDTTYSHNAGLRKQLLSIPSVELHDTNALFVSKVVKYNTHTLHGENEINK